MLKKACIFLILAFYLFGLTAFAADAKLATEINHLAKQYLREHRGDEHISAISITMVTPAMKAPISVHLGTQGFIDVKPINHNALFQIGSITKSYIAACLLKLQANPQLHFSVNDPIDQYFPEFPRWHGITVRMLLNMTSGIPDYFKQAAILNTIARYPRIDFQMYAWVNYMYQAPLLFQPGTQFNYSNTNYFILGLLIERLTGESVAENIQANFITPLHLQHTYYYPEQIKDKRQYLAHGYQYETSLHPFIPKGTDVTDYSLSYMYAAGGMISNTEDMTRWIQALFTPNKVLPEQSLHELTSLVSLQSGQAIAAPNAQDPSGYGLGIAAAYSPRLHTDYYFYQGMTLGYRSFYIYVPTRKMLVAITVNSSYDGPTNHLRALANQLLAVSEG